jgi:hypothetical protein
MELKLIKAYRHGSDRSLAHISISAAYGWRDQMYSDIVQISYDYKKNAGHITVRLKNPGAGAVVDRIAEYISKNRLYESGNNPPLSMIEKLIEHFDLNTDGHDPENDLS